jgi:hypothetical protein
MNKEKLTVEKDEYGTIRYRNASGELHNPDGPAVVWDGDRYYYINGQLHNPHGPAIVDTDGSKAYYINDKELSDAEFKTWQAEQSAK